jgi:hypothetical protein
MVSLLPDTSNYGPLAGLGSLMTKQAAELVDLWYAHELESFTACSFGPK